jgi:hypothetical protein
MKNSTCSTAAAAALALVALVAALSPAGAAGATMRSTSGGVRTGLYSGYTAAWHAFAFRIDANGTVGPFSTTVLFNCQTTDGYTRTRYATFALPATYLVTGGRFAASAEGAVVSSNDQPRFSIVGRVRSNGYATGTISVSQTSVVIGNGFGGVHLATEFCVSPTTTWTAPLMSR